MTNRTVLIIDDSPTSRAVQQAILREAGYDVSTAEDPEEGIIRARLEQPDLVLLDVMMPRIDGFAVCRTLRDDHETRHLPIILVTSRKEEGSVETGFASGCSDYVLKPIDRTEFLAKIGNYVSAGPSEAL